MNWIKMRTNLFDHPKVMRIGSILLRSDPSLKGGIGAITSQVVGCLLRIWAHADQHADGEWLHQMTIDEIDLMIDCPGFGQAMLVVGWLKAIECDTNGPSLQLVNYQVHNGKSAKKRALNANRADECRNRKALRERDDSNASSVTEALRERDGSVTNGVPRIEKNRKEKNKTEENPPSPLGGDPCVTPKIPYDPKNAEMPTELDCPEFRQAWADWFEYRRERKLSVYKQKTIELKLRELAEMGQAGAIAAIKQSISNGWHGIFPPKPTATTHTNGKTLSPEAQKTRDLFEATKKMILLKPSNDIPIAGPDLGLGFFKTAKTPNPTTEPPKLIADENKAHSDDEPKNELNW